MVMLPAFEDKEAVDSLAHINRKGQLNSGGAEQSWQPALAYLEPFTIKTVTRRADC